MENLIKIVELLNKPLHFFVIGVFLTLWGTWGQHSLDYICFGILLILISCCSFVDKKIKNYQLKKEIRLQEKKEEEKQKNFREGIIRAYENLPKDDRYVIDECLKANYPVFKNNYSISDSSIHSLHSQGWGTGNGYIFTIKSEYFNILQEYKKSKRLKKHSSKKKGKQHGKQ